MCKVSVIIPVCNVERYVEQCVRSVMNQSFSDLEIICINDGSRDGSPAILDRLASEDSRITVIHKENSGYGDTINLGLRSATGKYIGIVESDDYIEPDMYEKLLGIAECHEVDVVKCNFYEVSENGDKRVNEYLQAYPYDEVITYRDDLLLVGPTIWASLYRRDFLIDNRIELLPTPGASFQDTSFAFKVMYAAKNVYFIKDALVNYRVENETSSVNSKAKIFFMMTEMNEEKRYMIERGGEKDLPMLSRVKYLRYKWNLDRLSGTNKLKFLLLMHREFLCDDLHGYLIRNQWSEEDWIFIHKLIYDLNGAARQLLEGAPVYKAALESFSSEAYLFSRLFDVVYLYGNDVETVEAATILRNKKINVKIIETTNGVAGLENEIIIIWGKAEDISVKEKVSVLESSNIYNYIILG